MTTVFRRQHDSENFGDAEKRRGVYTDACKRKSPACVPGEDACGEAAVVAERLGTLAACPVLSLLERAESV